MTERTSLASPPTKSRMVPFRLGTVITAIMAAQPCLYLPWDNGCATLECWTGKGNVRISTDLPSSVSVHHIETKGVVERVEPPAVSVPLKNGVPDLKCPIASLHKMGNRPLFG